MHKSHTALDYAAARYSSEQFQFSFSLGQFTSLHTADSAIQKEPNIILKIWLI
jgi:hypothetical protein